MADLISSLKLAIRLCGVGGGQNPMALSAPSRHGMIKFMFAVYRNVLW